MTETNIACIRYPGYSTHIYVATVCVEDPLFRHSGEFSCHMIVITYGGECLPTPFQEKNNKVYQNCMLRTVSFSTPGTTEREEHTRTQESCLPLVFVTRGCGDHTRVANCTCDRQKRLLVVHVVYKTVAPCARRRSLARHASRTGGKSLLGISHMDIKKVFRILVRVKRHFFGA